MHSTVMPTHTQIATLCCTHSSCSFRQIMLYKCDMFPYTDKENEWLSTTRTTKRTARKSNTNRQRKVVETHAMDKRGQYWFVPYNKFKI